MTEPIYKAPLLTTPFHSRTAPLCRTNQWARWAGHITVDCYTTVEEEYFAIRNAATLYDVSPMTKYRITGPAAARYMNRLLTRDIDKLAPGRVGYAVWCNDGGKALDDGTVFRLHENAFQLNSQERHFCWLLDSALGYDVEVEEVTGKIAGLALQGPTSYAVLKALGLPGIAELKPYRIATYDFEDATLTVTRTGFTGDLGYELWIEASKAEPLWDRLREAGRLYGLIPAGSVALDLARIEAGFIQANTDFVPAEQAVRPSRRRSPFELGLGWLVDFEKGHFNGRRALLRERETGSRYCLVGLEIAGDKPAKDALIYYGKSREVGVATSAMWSPTLKRNIAIATLEAAYGQVDQGLWADIYVHRELKWEKVAAPCRIAERPFFNPRRRWATPPSDY